MKRQISETKNLYTISWNDTIPIQVMTEVLANNVHLNGHIQFDVDYSNYINIDLVYSREETTAEYKKRIKKEKDLIKAEKDRIEVIKLKKEEEERKLYLKLHKKFGKSNDKRKR